MRTHYCGEIGESLAGRTIEVAGWVHRRRDHGGVIFVDLRDRSGLLQVVFDPDTPKPSRPPSTCGREFCIQVQGKLRPRPAGTVNANLASGQIELLASKLVILNPSATPPFALDEEVGEELRLKHRYIDLRRDVMQERLRRRHAITRAMREYLDDHHFVDIETPMLTKATPEGARDYLVPSRTHPGKFFALPQSPQIFKQLLMMGGFDRYYQIVRCFRDEDLRADRQPEFTQLDIETSFLEQDAGHGAHGRPHPPRALAGARSAAAGPVPAAHLRRGHAPLRVRQAGPARPARARRRGRPRARNPSSRCSRARPPTRTGASRRCGCRAAAN